MCFNQILVTTSVSFIRNKTARFPEHTTGPDNASTFSNSRSRVNFLLHGPMSILAFARRLHLKRLQRFSPERTGTRPYAVHYRHVSSGEFHLLDHWFNLLWDIRVEKKKNDTFAALTNYELLANVTHANKILISWKCHTSRRIGRPTEGVRR